MPADDRDAAAETGTDPLPAPTCEPQIIDASMRHGKHPRCYRMRHAKLVRQGVEGLAVEAAL
jgi:hypothetical protein